MSRKHLERYRQESVLQIAPPSPAPTVEERIAQWAPNVARDHHRRERREANNNPLAAQGNGPDGHSRD